MERINNLLILFSSLIMMLIVFTCTAPNSSGSSGGGSSANGIYPPGYSTSATPPGANFNLSIWELQEPWGPTNNPNTVSPSSLNSYQDIFFYTDTADSTNSGKNITFWDPITGTTTSGSIHCRSEMREMSSSDNNNDAAWGYGAGTVNKMTVSGKVVMVPDHVCIGQIFQASGNSKPLIELFYYASGAIKAGVNTSADAGTPESITPITTVTVETEYTYSLELDGNVPNTIELTINGTTTPIAIPTSQDSSVWSTTMYFKAGDYDQTATAGLCPTSYTGTGTIVKIYSLSVAHSPAT